MPEDSVEAAIDRLDFVIAEHLRRARFIDAIAVATRQLDIRLERFGPGSAAAARSYRALGSIYHECGMYGTAEELARLALALDRRLLRPDDPEIARALTTLGRVLKDLQRFDDARAAYQEAVEILDRSRARDDLEFAPVFENLGHLERRIRREDAAEPLLRAALAIRRRHQGPESREAAEQEAWLAWLLIKRGKSAEAERLLRHALEVLKSTADPGEQAVRMAVHTLAVSRALQGDAAGAESLLATDLRPPAPERRPIGFGLRRADPGQDLLAELMVSRGEMRYARRLVEWRRSPSEAFASLARAERGRGDDGLDSQRATVLAMERRLDALAHARRRDGASALRLREATLIRLLHAQARLAALEWARTDSASREQAGASRGAQALLAPDQAIVGWLSVDWVGTPRKNAPEPGRSTEWAYVIRDRGPLHIVRLAVQKTIGETDAAYAKRLAHGYEILQASRWPERVGRDAGLDSLARDAYATYFAPLRPFLSGVGRLVVVRNGAAELFFVETWLDERGRYLGDHFIVSYTPSLRTWAILEGRRPGARRGGPGPALVLGDARFDGAATDPDPSARAPDPHPASSEGPAPLLIEGKRLRAALDGDADTLRRLPRLPFARHEVRRVAAALGGAATLTGLEATEETVQRLAGSGQLRVVHVATHALSDRFQVENSALVLSRAGAAPAERAALGGAPYFDGLVTTREIELAWKLDEALVTLSGCQTGAAAPTAADNLLEFLDPLLRAGAVTVVASPWKVDDAAAALLMERFYENLAGSRAGRRAGRAREPMRAAEALREAKLWMRNYQDDRGRRPFDHPAYWNAFILMGDPDWSLSK